MNSSHNSQLLLEGQWWLIPIKIIKTKPKTKDQKARPKGYTRRLYRKVKLRCYTRRLYQKAISKGYTTRLNHEVIPEGYIKRLYQKAISKAIPEGYIKRLYQKAIPEGYTRRLYQKTITNSIVQESSAKLYWNRKTPNKIASHMKWTTTLNLINYHWVKLCLCCFQLNRNVNISINVPISNVNGDGMLMAARWEDAPVDEAQVSIRSAIQLSRVLYPVSPP